MSCTDTICGTGGWTGPKPGDPDNNLTLSANAVRGGIDVSWSYPNTNPYAVAYTILCRGLSADLNAAIELGKVGGSIYFDKLNPTAPTQYYYWIQVMSTNGTLGDPVGPASAIAKPVSVYSLEELTGLIDDGVLAEALKTEIARIPVLDTRIIDEINDRISSNQLLTDTLDQLHSSLDDTMTLVTQEITERRDGDSALVDSINAIGAKTDANAAAIIEEQTVRTTKDEAFAADIQVLYTESGDNKAAIDEERTVRTTQHDAMAQQIDALVVGVGANSAAIQIEQTVRADAVSAVTQSVSNLASRVSGNESAIQTEQTTRATQDTAIAQSVTTLSSKVDTNTASIQTEATTRADADSALGQRIDTVQTSFGTNLASVQTLMQTQIDTTNGNVTQIGALWTAKVSVNGLVGGFGVYNDGEEVEAGFDVDRFWVGRTGPDGVKPFIIDNGIVYIDKARIRDADIDSLKLAGEAVTVPVVSTSGDKQHRGTGDSNYVVVNEGYMSMTQAGMLYVLATTAQGFYKNTANWRFRLRINGNIVRSIMGGVANDAPTFSASVAVPLGTAHVQLEWAAVSDVILGYTELFMMGVKR